MEFYTPGIAKAELKSVSRRDDVHALTRIVLWLALCVASGAWVLRSTGSWWLLPALFLHGILLSFSYAASHEFAHGTAMKTRWLNETMFWITSLIFGEEPIYRRYSHASHHSFTWYRMKDAQMPYYNPVSLGRYLSETAGFKFFWESARLLVAHSLGRIGADVKEFVPRVEEPKMRRNSVIFLCIYGGLIASAIIFRTWTPLLLYFVPRLLGGWFVNLYINTQHMCMQEGLPDHRYTTRSIRCNPLSRWLYWNMNFHIEHHMFPMVPFHALPALSRQIGGCLPVYARGVLGANADIVRIIGLQRTDPRVTATPELPERSHGKPAAQGPESASATSEQEISSGEWREVGTFNHLVDEDVEGVRVDGHDYAVYRCNGRLYVTDGRCTHMRALLCKGIVIGDVIECPVHQGRFHIPSGRVAGGPVCKDLVTYPTRLVEDVLFIAERRS